jgi:hypothetical protein
MDALPLPPLSGDQAEVVARMAELARTRFAPRAARHDLETAGKLLCGLRAATLEFQ